MSIYEHFEHAQNSALHEIRTLVLICQPCTCHTFRISLVTRFHRRTLMNVMIVEVNLYVTILQVQIGIAGRAQVKRLADFSTGDRAKKDLGILSFDLQVQ